ncbi:hypothetical protein SAMN05216403_101174 [Nitrosospira multiformis ATCC 25196]|uniref:Uncharacterized protein n=1 Tax=Nitrosospira multiformis (strain ATCC 25196 / NCIMB 11849 / C 71) TaxID=323848 RepID=A0A1H5RSA7_NITMU|nr:hypothetical protein SAMN05216403_101174 [Nitrosospira multiformis ATCC 25196]
MLSVESLRSKILQPSALPSSDRPTVGLNIHQAGKPEEVLSSTPG